MTKSECYTCAILAVLDSEMKASIKAEVLETLMERKRVEMILEKSEDEE